MKKPIYKKVWFWIVIIIVVSGAALSGGSSTSSETPQISKDNNTAKKEENKPQEVKAYKIGDKVAVGDVEYIVKKVSKKNEVGPSIAPTSAKDTFVVLKISVKNNGSKSIMVDSTFFKLLSNGKEFEADSMASMSANQNDNGEIKNSFFYESLNPDVSLSGYVVFDVSNSLASANDLQLQVQTGIFGTEKEIIDLKK